MTTIIKATYVQGVFRPQEPIALAEGIQVELMLTMAPEGSRGHICFVRLPRATRPSSPVRRDFWKAWASAASRPAPRRCAKG